VKTDLLVKFLYFMGRPEVLYYFKAVNTKQVWSYMFNVVRRKIREK